jgi:hypothetical protein
MALLIQDQIVLDRSLWKEASRSGVKASKTCGLNPRLHYATIAACLAEGEPLYGVRNELISYQ